VTVGWLILIAATVHTDPTGPGLGMGSPFFGAAFIGSLALEGPNARRWAMVMFAIFWTLFYAAAAWILFEAAVGTFDRCLGRMPEEPEWGLGRAVSGDYGLGYHPRPTATTEVAAASDPLEA
jgi:hypothetical protein